MQSPSKSPPRTWLTPLTKSKLMMLRNPAAMDVFALEPLELTWTDEDKLTARTFVQSSIKEQELALKQACDFLETKKNLLLGQMDNGVEMNVRTSLTQVKNAEAMRDHLMGVISSFEHLLNEIDNSETNFAWKEQCHEILSREPIQFSAKEDCNQPIHELKEMVRLHFLA
jgi:hypothetical protein